MPELGPAISVRVHIRVRLHIRVRHVRIMHIGVGVDRRHRCRHRSRCRNIGIAIYVTVIHSIVRGTAASRAERSDSQNGCECNFFHKFNDLLSSSKLINRGRRQSLLRS